MARIQPDNFYDAPRFWQAGAPAGQLPICTWPNGGAIYDQGNSGDGSVDRQTLQSNHIVSSINMNPNG
jgi:hypothetical protein